MAFSPIGKMFVKSLFATTLLSSSILAFAGNNDVLCPPASFIRNFLPSINTVSFYQWPSSSEKIFFASSEESNFDLGSNLWWKVYTMTNAKDFNTAFEMGRQNIIKINKVATKFAMESSGGFYCSY